MRAAATTSWRNLYVYLDDSVLPGAARSHLELIQCPVHLLDAIALKEQLLRSYLQVEGSRGSSSVVGVESECCTWAHGQVCCVGKGAAREGQARGGVQVQVDPENVEEAV